MLGEFQDPARQIEAATHLAEIERNPAVIEQGIGKTRAGAEQGGDDVAELAMPLEIAGRHVLGTFFPAFDGVLGLEHLMPEKSDRVLGFELVEHHDDAGMEGVAGHAENLGPHRRTRPPAALAHGELAELALPVQEVVLDLLGGLAQAHDIVGGVGHAVSLKGGPGAECGARGGNENGVSAGNWQAAGRGSASLAPSSRTCEPWERMLNTRKQTGFVRTNATQRF